MGSIKQHGLPYRGRMKKTKKTTIVVSVEHRNRFTGGLASAIFYSEKARVIACGIN